jgi:alkylhydroperoxidase family enzyme
VRFDSAREAGLTEDRVAEIEDGFECILEPAEATALILTDAIVQDTGALSDAQWDELREYYTDAEIAEIALGVTLFHGMSKVLICLGLEPEQMETTILPTPGSRTG